MLPKRSGGRVQNGCASRDAADTQGWRQPCRVCLGSAPASLACSSRRFQRSACTGLSVRRNAGKAGMLGAPTSWVAVAHANAASAKAGKGSARNIISYGGKPQELQSVREGGKEICPARTFPRRSYTVYHITIQLNQLKQLFCTLHNN